MILSINASIGRVHNLHHCGFGISHLPNLAKSGHANITHAFIFSDKSGSIVVELIVELSRIKLSSVIQFACHHNFSKIWIIKTTSDVLGTLCSVTGPFASTAAGINLMILFLFGTGLTVHLSGFPHSIINLGIG